ncbi:hypothetical protein [Spiroplasma taiwanense]|uniref:Uncharacterized protein n=1 Tax=Spiroplasma taiwanense CT-1 TaxID=1276220 RepID=S5LV71_9MOLU|nr:hypothetical protein [Spiroplasma taiwanense]AGR41674.1 hypothetical protein STAIW_v1c10910 [Spiroplasma taiwanense CT-1]
MGNKQFDAGCFKCVEEMQKTTSGGVASNILASKMQQNLAQQDLNSIHLCSKHS